MSVLPIDELLRVHTDHFALLCAIVARGGSPSLSALVVEKDPAAGKRFIKRLDRVHAIEQREIKRLQGEKHRIPVMSAIVRARGHDILGEM